MRKLALFAALLFIGGSNAFAITGNCPTTVAPGSPYACTLSVYNDSGSDLTSGTVVVWDNDDTEFDRTGYPYVTTTTSADLPWVAGVVKDATCKANNTCTIVTEGFAWTLIADATDAVTEDDFVGTSTVAGQAGASAGGADTCALGQVLELYAKGTGTDTNADGQVFPVWVNLQCDLDG